jgi:glutamate transport system substrate-binding protein
MRISRTFAALAALATAGVVLTACSSEAGNQAAGNAGGSSAAVATDVTFPAGSKMADLNAAKKITIGTKFDQPGFGLLNPTTKVPEGFDVEMGKLIAAKLGIPADGITWTETVSANREAFIQNGQVDIVVATYTINDKRKQVVDFAGPYYEAGQDIMVVKGNPKGIKGPDDLAGKKVCSVEGSTPAENIRTKYPQAQLTLFDVYSKCADALTNGQVDAVTTDNVILTGLVAGNPQGFELVNNPFTKEPYGIGLAKGDKDFRAFINDTLQAAFDDGSWAAAWDRTAGAISGTKAPTPPTIDRY